MRQDGEKHPSCRNLRLAVLSELVGRDLASTKDLYKWEAHTLIDYLQKAGNTELSNDGYTLVSEAEKIAADRVKDRPADGARGRKAAAHLPGMQPAHHRSNGNARGLPHQGRRAGGAGGSTGSN